MSLLDRPELSCEALPDMDGTPWRVRVLGPDPTAADASLPAVVLDKLLDNGGDDDAIVFPLLPFLMALRPPGLASVPTFDPGPDPFPPAGDPDHGKRGD